MSAYEDVVKISKEFKTLSALITALGKVKAKTEDAALIQGLDMLILRMQNTLINSKDKSIPVSLEHSSLRGVKSLLAYCQKAIGTKKPEWQILAERNGWQPPK